MPMKSFEDAEREENESQLFICRIEYEELLAELEDPTARLAEADKLTKESRMVDLDKQIRALEKELGIVDTHDAAKSKKDKPDEESVAKKDKRE